MGRNSSYFLFFIVASVRFCFLITGQSSSRVFSFTSEKSGCTSKLIGEAVAGFLLFIVASVRFCLSATGGAVSCSSFSSFRSYDFAFLRQEKATFGFFFYCRKLSAHNKHYRIEVSRVFFCYSRKLSAHDKRYRIEVSRVFFCYSRKLSAHDKRYRIEVSRVFFCYCRKLLACRKGGNRCRFAAPFLLPPFALRLLGLQFRHEHESGFGEVLADIFADKLHRIVLYGFVFHWRIQVVCHRVEGDAPPLYGLEAE